MKHLKNIHTFICLVLVASTLALTQSCSTELENRYMDPEQTDIPNIPAFMTQIMNNSRIRSEYWHYRTFVLMHHARYTQTTYFGINNTMYQQQDSYVNSYWQDFYAPGMMGVYRAMERTFAAMTDEEKAINNAYMHAARIIVYQQASKLVDNFGDIPFSEAGSLPATDRISLGRFDNQQELYYQFIDGMEEAAEFFRTYQSSNDFSRTDILNHGITDKWRRYANSLRLRLLMRISRFDETKARTEIMHMLASPSDYPLIDADNSVSYTASATDVLNQPLTNYTSSLLDAVRELNNHYAPDYMVNTVLAPSNDPRIHVLFDRYGQTRANVFVPNDTYQALPINTNETEANTEYGRDTLRRYAVVDSATAWINNLLPGILITSPEINFIKAEAQERWGSTEAAKTAYDIAVQQSISFYYDLNNNSSHSQRVPRPSAAVVAEFIQDPHVAYNGTSEDKLRLIGTQKWLHFGWLQAEQAWAEYRRTGYPVLPAFPESNLNNFENPPLRLVYPSNEVTNNSSNYEAVRAQDTRDTRIFWDVD